MAASISAKGGTAIAVSVVLPTHGQPHLLDRCLGALMRQTLPAARYEVIIVDDAPSHRTLRLVDDWRARAHQGGPRLVYLSNGGPHGPAAARNRGWRVAQGPLIAFTADDAVPAPGWLAAGLAAFNAGADAVCGRTIVRAAAGPAGQQRCAGLPGGTEFASANCFCRKQVLERLDGFDERFTAPWRDDSDLHFRLLGIGAAIVHAPRAVVLRPVPPAPWGASLLHVKRMVFDALLYKKHPRLYREKIEPMLRPDDYRAVAALLLSGAAAADGQAPLAILAFLAWLAFTLRLCARRLAGTAHFASQVVPANAGAQFHEIGFLAAQERRATGQDRTTSHHTSPLRRQGPGFAPTVPHVAEIILTSALLPPLAVFWRLAGAIRFRVRFA